MVGRVGEQNSPPSVPILIVDIQTCAPKGAVGDEEAARDRKLERVYDVASPLATMWPLETSTVQVFTLIPKSGPEAIWVMSQLPFSDYTCNKENYI